MSIKLSLPITISREGRVISPAEFQPPREYYSPLLLRTKPPARGRYAYERGFHVRRRRRYFVGHKEVPVTQLRKMMLEELQRRNYSQTTVNTYLKVVEDFTRHFHRPPDQLGKDQIRAYQVYLFQERKLGVRTVGLHTAALRFFFCKTLKRAYPVEEVPIQGAAPSADHSDREEAVAGSTPPAPFPSAILIDILGVRQAQLCRLKVEDIDSTRMLIHIRQGKGGKDRDVPLSPKALETLSKSGVG